MVIVRTRNKITDFLMILAWASPFNPCVARPVYPVTHCAARPVYPQLTLVLLGPFIQLTPVLLGPYIYS